MIEMRTLNSHTHTLTHTHTYIHTHLYFNRDILGRASQASPVDLRREAQVVGERGERCACLPGGEYVLVRVCDVAGRWTRSV